MSCELWIHGQKIGTTRFELRATPRKRAGVFQPTAFGMTVLPSITAMTRALLDFGEVCRRNGIRANDMGPETSERTVAAFSETPEGQRVIAAARQIAALELRDASGTPMAWESIAVSDINDLIAASERLSGRTAPARTPAGDPVRYLITVTLREERSGGDRPQPHPPIPIAAIC
jgi:hypothetical protein